MFYLLNREMPVNLEEITGALRALHVVDLLARGDGFGNADDLRDPLNAAIVLPEANVRIAPETPPERPRVREQQERHKVERQHSTALWGRYQRQGSSIARAAARLNLDSLKGARSRRSNCWTIRGGAK